VSTKTKWSYDGGGHTVYRQSMVWQSWTRVWATEGDQGRR
jgi:hypothetical protein